LATSDVDWFEANRNVVILHSGGKRHTFRTTMENLAAALDPVRFARIHRSAIVNLDRIKEVQSWFHGNWRVVLKDGTSLMLSSRYRESLARFRRVP
jgi:two-component system, LytTR family, response regulator